MDAMVEQPPYHPPEPSSTAVWAHWIFGRSRWWLLPLSLGLLLAGAMSALNAVVPVGLFVYPLL